MQDRVVQYPSRYKLTKVGTDTYDLVSVPGTVTAEGTPINKANIFNASNDARYGLTDGKPSEAFEKLTQVLTCNVPVSGWSTAKTDGWYTNEVTVSGMKAVYNPTMDLVITSATLAEAERESFGQIAECETFDGYVILRVLDVPDASFNVRFVGV